MQQRILLLTPPFTQLNTPYPATAYLKGFLNTQGVKSRQLDLGIEVINQLFSKKGFEEMFAQANQNVDECTDNSKRIYDLKDEYISVVGPVIQFLQKKDDTLAHHICAGGYLPQAGRFSDVEELDWAFGTMGVQDKARHLATLFLEDVADFIKETLDPHFGFSRYAERLAESASSFDDLFEELQYEPTFIDEIALAVLEKHIQEFQPTAIGMSIPFPGNLYSGLRCGQFIKQEYSNLKVFMGGGYPNTELRSLSEKRLFDFVDYVSLDDGERPLLNLLHFLEDNQIDLKRTFKLEKDRVLYENDHEQKDFSFTEIGTPDYGDLRLDKYLSVIELVNPMHRLWSDGRWNKLTLAHGCYWGKCSFCDISLDYIKNYEPVIASQLCDQIETIIDQTGETGFHFVDEAAPPALMRDLALEILKRKLTISWWTNIRFERSFTEDLCKLLRLSGCIAVSGGLEVASDRLLAMMKKGVTIKQVAQVTHNFADNGIMVHAYLMYGFPTQTAQETIDSLEIVRQLFINGVVQSAYWHQFAMTAHSPVGLSPEDFGVKKVGPDFQGFADNDYQHEDKQGADHGAYSEGLKKSLFNYMHGVCLDFDHQEWFNFDVPYSTHDADLISGHISNKKRAFKNNALVIWTGSIPRLEAFEKKRKGELLLFQKMSFVDKTGDFSIQLEVKYSNWLFDTLADCSVSNGTKITFSNVSKRYRDSGLGDFDKFKDHQAWQILCKKGLLFV